MAELSSSALTGSASLPVTGALLKFDLARRRAPPERPASDPARPPSSSRRRRPDRDNLMQPSRGWRSLPYAGRSRHRATSVSSKRDCIALVAAVTSSDQNWLCALSVITEERRAGLPGEVDRDLPVEHRRRGSERNVLLVEPGARPRGERLRP